MSILAMTEVAVVGRKDVEPANYVPVKYSEIAGAARGKNTPEDNIDTAIQTLITYIPTEIITVYLAALAAVRDSQRGSMTAEWIVFKCFLVATPIVVLLVYIGKVINGQNKFPWFREWPYWEMTAATVAFAAWAFALPDSPFQEYEWYNTHPALPGAAAAV